jgi:hypothetical protein
MSSFFFIPLSLVMALTVWSCAVAWYYWPWARRVSLKDAATPILLLNAFRFEGLGFLVPGVVSPDLNPVFAAGAGYGDLAAACLALLALVAVRFGSATARPLMWLFALVGLLDLVDAYGLGITFSRPGQIASFGPGFLQSMYFIPTFAAPLLIVTDVALVLLLLRKRGSPG